MLLRRRRRRASIERRRTISREILTHFRENRSNHEPGSAPATPFTTFIMPPVLKGCPYSITERRVPELIPVLGSQPAGGVSHKPGGRLPLLSAMPAVTPATLKRAATNFAAC